MEDGIFSVILSFICSNRSTLAALILRIVSREMKSKVQSAWMNPIFCISPDAYMSATSTFFHQFSGPLTLRILHESWDISEGWLSELLSRQNDITLVVEVLDIRKLQKLNLGLQKYRIEAISLHFEGDLEKCLPALDSIKHQVSNFSMSICARDQPSNILQSLHIAAGISDITELDVR